MKFKNLINVNEQKNKKNKYKKKKLKHYPKKYCNNITNIEIETGNNNDNGLGDTGMMATGDANIMNTNGNSDGE